MAELALTTELARPGNRQKKKEKIVLNRLLKSQVEPSDQVQSSNDFDQVSFDDRKDLQGLEINQEKRKS